MICYDISASYFILCHTCPPCAAEYLASLFCDACCCVVVACAFYLWLGGWFVHLGSAPASPASRSTPLSRSSRFLFASTECMQAAFLSGTTRCGRGCLLLCLHSMTSSC